MDDYGVDRLRDDHVVPGSQVDGVLRGCEAHVALEHLEGGFSWVSVVMKLLSGAQGYQCLAQVTGVPTVHGHSGTPTWRHLRCFQMLRGQFVQIYSFHGLSLVNP